MPRKAETIKRKAVEAVTELAEVLAEEAKSVGEPRTPGATVRGGKVPWTRGDIERTFPMVTFMPEETVPVSWNGVRYQLLEGIEATVPSCIKGIYDDYRRRVRSIGRDLPSMGVTKSVYGGEL